ncbi:glycoside hydrolase family 30 beta sandwich domain-containing protein [Haoranjiania flava]|uniref:Glucosylceramidase n=1 Tax=Haoranjiania flava TaxID=1856322 RepID=A0AAE3IKA8_9BACT|nr:glycoside hydrolase family 30 beta sandwich domain-containing protein [Haoranjiania flava]MCU7693757.1 glucosylceramidase [Haoranjiania flava]
MKKSYLFFNIVSIFILGLSAKCNKEGGGNINPTPSPATDQATIWITKADKSVLFQKLDKPILFTTLVNKLPTIDVDDTKTYQSVDGFGYTLTGGSAMLINKMSPTAKNHLLKELFDNTGTNIGITYLRLSMGASDLDERVFSYNDLPEGETDINQKKFSIAPDKVNLIPVLKSILAINPNIKIIATPWSPPAWMKDNNSSVGGSLKPEYYHSYATYFVKYIQAMKSEGINIDAVAPQNEPLHPGNNPSMLMTAEQQRDFIKHALGPVFKSNGIVAKIIIYDHNLDNINYPTLIYGDPEATKYVDGAAFHLYAGNVEAMGTLYQAFPNKNLYFTEQWTGSTGTFEGDLVWHIRNVIIGTMRNHSKIALEWNLANDPTYGPHTPGGCTQCKGALTINNSEITRNVSYYIIAHASKFVTPGSLRIHSNNAGAIMNVTFLTPGDKKVMIALNEGNTPYSFNIKDKGKWAPVTIDGKTVMTIIW